MKDKATMGVGVMDTIMTGFFFLACSCVCLFIVRLYKLAYYSVEKTCNLREGVLKEYLDYPGGTRWKYPVVTLTDGEELVCNLVRTTSRKMLPAEGQMVRVWVNEKTSLLKGYLYGFNKTVNGSGFIGMCLSFSFSMLFLIGIVFLTYGLVIMMI